MPVSTVRGRVYPSPMALCRGSRVADDAGERHSRQVVPYLRQDGFDPHHGWNESPGTRTRGPLSLAEQRYRRTNASPLAVYGRSSLGRYSRRRPRQMLQACHLVSRMPLAAAAGG